MSLIRLTSLLLALSAWQVHAQPPQPSTGTGLPDTPGLHVAAGQSPFGAALPATALEALRGGSSTVNTANLDGAVSNNTASQVNTGSNLIDGGSFANLSGIPIVIQNTGANVLIQSAVILNLQMN